MVVSVVKYSVPPRLSSSNLDSLPLIPNQCQVKARTPLKSNLSQVYVSATEQSSIHCEGQSNSQHPNTFKLVLWLSR
jgi:hypothetical protein